METSIDNVLPGLVINKVRLKNVYLYDEAEYAFKPGITLIKGEQYTGKTDLFRTIAISLGIIDEYITGTNYKNLIGDDDKAEIELILGYEDYQKQIRTEIYPDKIKWFIDKEEDKDSIKAFRARFGISLIDKLIAIPYHSNPMEYHPYHSFHSHDDYYRCYCEVFYVFFPLLLSLPARAGKRYYHFPYPQRCKCTVGYDSQ